MDVTHAQLAGAVEEVRLNMIHSQDIGNLSSEALAKRLLDALPCGRREPDLGMVDGDERIRAVVSIQWTAS